MRRRTDNVVRMYTCGLTVYARGHIGNFRTFVAVDVLRRALKYQAGYAVRQVTQLHRRRRSHDPRIAESRRAAARIHRSLHRGVQGGRGGARARAGRGEPARDRSAEHRRDGRDDRGARAARPHLSQRRIDLLQDRDAAGIRQARAARSRRHQERRARRLRQVREGRRARLRALESDEAGRAALGPGDRPGPPRLAHRVLGDGAAPARASRRSTSTAAASI